MMLFLLLFLAAVLSPSLLQDDNENMEIEHLQTTKKSVQEDIVKKHNQLRRMVFPPGSDLLKMKWDLHGEWRAQMWADKCIFEKSPVEFRDMDLHCGENIFVSEYPLSWSCVIQSWYDKSIDYRFGSNILPDEYIQIVWNSSYTIACGVSKCPDKPLKFMYVCRYCPLFSGNLLRRLKFPYTVGEPCAQCPDHCDNGLCTSKPAENHHTKVKTSF
ncbi:cysteine-rich secretory protein 1-like isoform X2 [Peromyscus maniculatus bairdii]|uniref:cysteine-rich secretory protein 1-like isoform X2 n=1 Tax=Peromyscus maniculatus bairdii TaxID=230844 RepID=UPI003FD431A2